MDLTCCGMNLLHPSGNLNDTAHCLTCTWTAAGTYAEHAGTHHYYDTGHQWHLSVYQPESAGK